MFFFSGSAYFRLNVLIVLPFHSNLFCFIKQSLIHYLAHFCLIWLSPKVYFH